MEGELTYAYKKGHLVKNWKYYSPNDLSSIPNTHNVKIEILKFDSMTQMKMTQSFFEII